jgi:TP901 family phage tail tape measure protein
MADDLRVIVDADASPLKRELVGAGGDVRVFGREVKSQSRGALAFNAALDKQRESLRGVGTFAKTAGFAIGGVFAVGIASAIKTGAEFESQMARVQAVTGATGKEMDQLRKLAIKLGADTKFSANDAAEAMYELSSAGFDVQETQKALPGTLSLAAASSVDLATAAEISSNALRGFGLQSEESTHVSDVLAQSVNSSSVEMEDLQLSLKYIGPVARVTGESFEEMIAAVSLMGDAGIKGEQAGTTLRAGLVRLVKPTKQVKEGLSALGLEIEDLQGPDGLLPLPELVAKLEGGMEGLSKAQRAQALAGIFGSEALSGMLTVVDAGPEKLRRLTKEFENSNGASAKAAKTMNDTVKGSFEQLKGSFETVEIELYEHFSEPLKKALLDATHFVNVEGEQLQKALDEAMATPEFEEGDIGERAEILADAVGKVWKDSGLQDDITEGLITAFNYALPKVAEAAGKGSLVVAESFFKGFMESDALGRLVISAWLFTKLGGFAALRAAGARAGTQVGVGIEEGIATSRMAGGTGPIAGNLERDAKKKGTSWGTTFSKYAGRAMTGLLIADAGSIAGSAVGGGGGGVLSAMGAGAGVGMMFGPQGALVGAGAGALAGAVASGGDEMGSKFAASFAEGFETDIGPKLSEALEHKDIGKLEGLRKKLRTEIGLALSGGASDADVKPLRDRLNAIGHEVEVIHAPRVDLSDNLDSLRSGVVTRMADIKKLVQRNAQDIADGWAKGGQGWRTKTTANMEAAVTAIKAGMRKGVIATGDGQKQIAALLHNIDLVQGNDPFKLAQGFASSWKAAGRINRDQIQAELADLRKMPPAAREILQSMMVSMAQAMESKGKLVKGSADRLRSALVTNFGQTKTESLAQWVSLVKGVGLGASSLNDVVGVGIGAMAKNVNSALEGFGVSKKFAFSLTTVGKVAAAEGAAILGIGRQKGGIVPGIGDGDKVPRRVRNGTFILNREATTANGFRDGGLVPVVLEPGEREFTPEEVKKVGLDRLEAMNAAVPRHLQEGGHVALKKGGTASLKKEQVSGPEPMRSLGQAALDQVLAAATAYVEKHQPKGGVGGTAYGPKGIGAYKGVPMANWVIQALQHAAGKGVDPQPTSGYRSHAQNVSEGRNYISEHEFDQYPRGAVDFGGMIDPASLPAKMAVVNATKDFKYPLLAPIGFRDDGHASGTGHQLGGLVRALSVGGSVPLADGELVGASYYGGPTDGVSGTVGAAGVSLPGKMAFAELAMGKALGGLDFHTKLKIGYNGKSVVAEKLDIGLGGNDVGGRNRAIDLWYETADAISMPSTAVVKVSPADGSTKGSAKEEKVPATYHGVRTDSLNFGSTPDSLRGVEREIKKRRAELPRYRAAAKTAEKEGKTKIEQAIRANITSLENRIHQLERERAKLRREIAKKKVGRRIAKAVGKVTGFEGLIDAKKRIYDLRSQFAEQVVGLEPTQPELPRSATDAQREGSEKAYVAHLADYIRTKEQPAYAAVLDSEAVWRNTILQGETKAAGQWSKGSIGGMEGAFENQIINLRENIDTISNLPHTHSDKWWHEHPDALKKLHQLMAKLPMMRFKEREVAKALTETREEFYPGGAKVKRPSPPPPGTGAFEEDLAEVQGIHWPGLHEQIAQLPAARVPGSFGGAIWDTQEAIEGLGLKISQAESSIETGELDDSNSGWTAAKEAIALQDKQNLALSQGETRVFGDFFRELGLPLLGAYMQGTGGMRIGTTGLAMLHRDEMVVPDPKGPAGSQFTGSASSSAPPQVTLYVDGNIAPLMGKVRAEIDGKLAKVDTMLGAEGRRRAFAPGR